MKKIFVKIMLVMVALTMAFSTVTLIQEPVSISAAEYTQNEIVEFAKKQLGKRYVGLTEGPNSFDCTGFVKYVYNHFGISVPRDLYGYSSGVYSRYGTYVSVDNLQPGDIVLYGTSVYNLTHAALYVGNGLIINALNPSYGVVYNYVTRAASYKYPGYNTFALNVPALYGIRPYGRVGNKVTKTESLGSKVDLGHSFTAEIVDKSTSKLVTAEGSSVTLTKRSSKTLTKQKWVFTRATDGSYIIQNVKNNQALDVTGGNIKENSEIKTAKSNQNLKRQKYYIQKCKDGSYTLRPMISKDKVFTMTNSKSVLSAFTGKAEQKFKIIKTDQITIKYDATKGTGTVGSTLMNFGKVLTLKTQGYMKRDGYEFQGWYAYRASDKKYYCGSVHKWQTSEAIEKNGYKKTVFKANTKHTINYNWLKSKLGLQNIYMKASWKKIKS